MSRLIPKSRERSILLVIPKARRGDLESLVCTYRARGIEVMVEHYEKILPDVRTLVETTDADALLLAGCARRSPRRALPAPILINRAGRSIPAAWLPLVNPTSAHRFGEVVARVHRRRIRLPTVALLGQWQPRYLHIADRLQRLLEPSVPTFRWTEELIGRSELLGALGVGLGLGLYIGHGRPAGWSGYHGMRRQHLAGFDGEPLGGLMSLCCQTASRFRIGVSYAENVVLSGLAAASFGAVRDTLHTDNTRWAVRICNSLSEGAAEIGELVVRSAPLSPEAVTAYRLIGDPLAPLFSEPNARHRAAAVVTHP